MRIQGLPSPMPRAPLVTSALPVSRRWTPFRQPRSCVQSSAPRIPGVPVVSLQTSHSPEISRRLSHVLLDLYASEVPIRRMARVLARRATTVPPILYPLNVHQGTTVLASATFSHRSAPQGSTMINTRAASVSSAPSALSANELDLCIRRNALLGLSATRRA